MIEQRDPLEKRFDNQRASESDVHENFRPRDTSARRNHSQDAPEQAETRKEMQHEASFGTELQGDIGEGVALRVASERLGLTPDPRFDQVKHGLDGVYRDSKGKLVVVDSKCDERGIHALKDDQMQREWLARNSKMMQDPSNERFTAGNAEIGADIERQGIDQVRRLVIATHPASLEVKIYEGQPDGSWKQIDNWNAWDLEQPYLKD